MSTTKRWAASLEIQGDMDLPPIAGYSEPYARSAGEVAIRALLLHGLVAIAYGVKAQPIMEWFEAQQIANALTPRERSFLSGSAPSESERVEMQWKQEAEWTLLWMLGKVESLGLPTQCCDTRRLVDEIIPGLGDDLRDFIAQSEMRSPGALLAEDDRTYDLWCAARAALRRGENLPTDLNLRVLRERRYAFEWMCGNEVWDEVTCDA
jgi:hypothetical protein